MELEQLEADVRRTRSRLDSLRGQAVSVAQRGKAVQEEILTLDADIDKYAKVSVLLNKIGEDRQTSAQEQIQALVTHGLRTIFGEDLSFHMIASTARGSSQLDFMVRTTLESGEQIDTPVMEARGGGLAATVGFLLRLVVLLLSTSRQETVLFLDETFAMVSAEYLDRLGEFLRELVDRTGVQIVMVTHQPALAEHADTVYRFTQRDGATQVNREV